MVPKKKTLFCHNNETLNLAYTQKLLKYHMGTTF